jgi:hypothetical protein
MRRIPIHVIAAVALMAFAVMSPSAAHAAPPPSRPSVTVQNAAPAQYVAAASNPCGGSPYACADGHFHAWRGDTGARCSWVGNAPTLGSCTNRNDAVANLGYRCSGCDWIRLYWGSWYSGAFFCLPPGYIYAQATSPSLRFNRGAGLSGYGQSIWYNTASARWSGPC